MNLLPSEYGYSAKCFGMGPYLLGSKLCGIPKTLQILSNL